MKVQEVCGWCFRVCAAVHVSVTAPPLLCLCSQALLVPPWRSLRCRRRQPAHEVFPKTVKPPHLTWEVQTGAEGAGGDYAEPTIARTHGRWCLGTIITEAASAQALLPCTA